MSGNARRRAALLLGLAALAGLPTRPLAHDVPDQIVLHAWVRPEPGRLRTLLRIPLVMLASVGLPKRGPGYIALDRLEEPLERSLAAVTREIGFLEDGVPLAPERAVARVSLPSDRSFETFEGALASIEGPPLPDGERVFWNQGYLDVHVVYPIRSVGSAFALDFQVAPALSGRLKLVARYVSPEGPVRAYEVHGGYGRLELDPSWFQAARTFARLGFGHILDGLDHLLFLLCLLAPFGLRHAGRLAAVVTAFTVAHSVTLVAAALGLAPEGGWFPPLVEVLIAASILYMAVENAVAELAGRGADALRWRWLVAGGFGLVHGFGFSFALRQDLQLAGDHLLLSLLAFNVGVELGQLLVLAVVLPVFALAFRLPGARRVGLLLVSAAVGHTAWHWLVERVSALRVAPWPALAPGRAAQALGVVASAGLLAALLVLAARRIGSRRPVEGDPAGRRPPSPPRPGPGARGGLAAGAPPPPPHAPRRDAGPDLAGPHPRPLGEDRSRRDDGAVPDLAPREDDGHEPDRHVPADAHRRGDEVTPLG